MKVSVITTAYHHEKTIQRAIDSVNAQSFKDFDHIIIDDTHTNNGMLKTYHEAFNRCNGEYITLCDADDYWTYEHRLRDYVEYMDSHPSCGFCFSRVYTEDSNGIHEMTVSAEFVNKNISFDNLLKGNAFIHAQSFFIRKRVFDKYINFSKYLKFNVWDLPIVLELINHTKFHCLDSHTAVYVKNEESATNTKSRSRRLKYILGNYKIKLHFILKYGCNLKTILYLCYRFTRDMYSIIMKRWYK